VALPGTVTMLEARYANHFKVGHNEYEFFLEFGQFHVSESSDDRDSGGEDGETSIGRIVVGPVFARALLETLQRAVDEYEDAHGPIARS
jgi:hypothetical protein